MSFGGKVKGFLGSPIATFGALKQDTLGGAVKYALIWLLIFGAIFGIIFAVAFGLIAGIIGMFVRIPGWVYGLGPVLIPVTIGFAVVGGIVGLFVGGAWTHLWVYLLGGRQGYTQTFKALAYGATPSYALGWIPYVGGLVGGIWALVLHIIGLRQLHDITTGRAVGAYLLAMFIPLVILIIIAVAG